MREIDQDLEPAALLGARELGLLEQLGELVVDLPQRARAV
jgi:hypothetical protein